MRCVTCGDEILPERTELGFTYCTKRACVRANAAGLLVAEIAQHKTNAEYVILRGEAGQRALRDMREGKYRRDPVVVKREHQHVRFDVPKGEFRKPRVQKYPSNRIKFVQALANWRIFSSIKNRAAGLTSRRQEATCASRVSSWSSTM